MDDSKIGSQSVTLVSLGRIIYNYIVTVKITISKIANCEQLEVQSSDIICLRNNENEIRDIVSMIYKIAYNKGNFSVRRCIRN